MNIKLLQKLTVLILCMAAGGRLCAQGLSPYDYHSNVKSISSPNATAIGKFGDAPVDLYTGTPNIDIPLTSAVSGYIEVPVSLSYNATGVAINEIPGWAGLNWSLNAGGQIRRKVNHIQDEFNNFSPNVVGSTVYEDKGFFFKGGLLNVANWNTTAFMTSVLNTYNSFLLDDKWKGATWDYEPDEFQFSFGGYSGSFYRSEKGEWKVKSKQNITLEVAHEILTGNTTDYRLYDVDFTLDALHYSKVASLFTKFTITTPDGYRYVFGGDTSAIEFSRGQIGPYGSGSPVDVANPKGFTNPIIEHEANYITANTWNLTKIYSPKGDSVTLKYVRGQPVFQKHRGYVPAFYDGDVHQSTLSSVTATAVDPSYLIYIETPTQKIEFSSVLTTELRVRDEWLYVPTMTNRNWVWTITGNWGDHYSAYSSTIHAGIEGKMPQLNRQLDSIKVFDKIRGAYVNGYKFYHSASELQRRTLDSISTFSFTDAATNGKYKFIYSNVSLLPRYESVLRDHYGFYRGGTEPDVEATARMPRDVEPSLSTYGLISKIVYPTGGETEFQFEAGSFSSYVNFNPLSATPVSLVSGVGYASNRIRKIISRGLNGSPDMVTEYFYRKDYASGGITSSGVLSVRPRYDEALTYTIDWGGGFLGSVPGCNGSNTIQILTDDNSETVGLVKGGIVGYAEVAEKKSDGSYRVVQFTSNAEAEYRDAIHDAFAAAGGPWIGGGSLYVAQNENFRISSNDLERGNIKSEIWYNATGAKVKATTYEYTNDPLRKNEFIKAFATKELYTGKRCGDFALSSVPRGWTYKIYTYKNPLKSVTETLYEGGQAITTSQSYEYDQYGNVTQQTSYNSAGEKLVTDTRYNVHPDYQGTATGATALGIKRLLANYRIKNYPVEQTTLLYPPAALSEKFTDGTLYVYDADKPAVAKVYKMELDAPFQKYTVSGGTGTLNYLPSAFSSGNLSFNNKYKLQESVTAFTTSGCKPLTVARQALSLAYTWDNRYQTLSSVTTGAYNANVAYCNFEGVYDVIDDNKGNWDFGADYIVSSPTAPMGSRVLNLVATTAGPQNELRTMNSLVAGSRYVLSFWIPDPVVSSRFPKVYTGTTLLPAPVAKKSANGWIYHELVFTAGNGKLSIKLPAAASGTISNTLDEVRLYPEGASMKSYTNDAVNGNVTNACDEHNVITHYEYDGMGRLTTVKDEQGKIINRHTYQYQGAE